MKPFLFAKMYENYLKAPKETTSKTTLKKEDESNDTRR